MDTTRSPDITDANTPRKPEDPSAPFFSVQEVAYLTKKSVRTIRRRIAEGAPCSRRHKRAMILVSREDLNYYYEMDRVGGRRPPRTRRATSAA
ncbi:hypothetical protein [Streptomyces yangpuensis]|uniref:hypothetical protein n=1 Tax=Streptomyces yangpuensis TaxID=1648182 RepID=UPI0035E0D61D